MVEKNSGSGIKVPLLEETAQTLDPSFRKEIAEIRIEAYERVTLNSALRSPYSLPNY